jgi:hypothetical protein
LSRQSGTTADDSASHYRVFLRLYSPNRVETARFTVTPKDFAPTRFQRDQSGVATLRSAPLNLRTEAPLSSRITMTASNNPTGHHPWKGSFSHRKRSSCKSASVSDPTYLQLKFEPGSAISCEKSQPNEIAQRGQARY